jgi:hypothetical protein
VHVRTIAMTIVPSSSFGKNSRPIDPPRTMLPAKSATAVAMTTFGHAIARSSAGL